MFLVNGSSTWIYIKRKVLKQYLKASVVSQDANSVGLVLFHFMLNLWTKPENVESASCPGSIQLIKAKYMYDSCSKMPFQTNYYPNFRLKQSGGQDFLNGTKVSLVLMVVPQKQNKKQIWQPLCQHLAKRKIFVILAAACLINLAIVHHILTIFSNQTGDKWGYVRTSLMALC